MGDGEGKFGDVTPTGDRPAPPSNRRPENSVEDTLPNFE